MLHPNSKSANILKVALQRRRISKALQLFKGGSVFDALHRRVHYFQKKVSIIQALFKLQQSFHSHTFSISSNSQYKQSHALRWWVCYIQILNVQIFWMRHFKHVTFPRCFSYSKVAQYLKHSARRCATSRRVSIIQATAFSAMRGSDVLFPNDFGEDLLLLFFNMTPHNYCCSEKAQDVLVTKISSSHKITSQWQQNKDGRRWRHTFSDGNSETVSACDVCDKMSLKLSHTVTWVTAVLYLGRTETKLTKLIGAQRVTLARHCQLQHTHTCTYRVAQRTICCSLYHIVVTVQDKMKQISPKWQRDKHYNV